MVACYRIYKKKTIYIYVCTSGVFILFLFIYLVFILSPSKFMVLNISRYKTLPWDPADDTWWGFVVFPSEAVSFYI